MKIKKKVKTRVLSSILACTMVFSGLPQQKAMAAPTREVVQHGYDKTIVNTYIPGNGTIYYVDSKDGDDNNTGTSENQAYKSLSKVNEITLKPGDSILLKKGSIFDDQQLTPKGRGTEENRILIGNYGEGEQLPVINANRKFLEAVLIENMEYVTINGIEMTNDDVFNETTLPNDPNNNKDNWDRRLGLHIAINEDADTMDKDNRAWKGINVDGCFIHDVDGDENRNTNKLSGGIGVEIKFRNRNKIYPYYDGVILQNNTIESVDRTGIKGVRLTELENKEGDNVGEDTGGDGIRYANIRKGEGENQVSLNYIVRNNNLSDIGGDGILVDSTKGALIENNLLYNHTMRGTGANAGIWSWNTFDTVFQYNESYGGPAYNQDGCSYDSDYNSAGTIFQYNYSHDTTMGFMLIMGGNDTDIIRYNLSQNDGMVWRHIANGSNTPSYIYNNVFYYDGANWEWSLGSKNSVAWNWEFYNNIFYNWNTNETGDWGNVDWSAANISNNIVYEASGKYSDKEIADAIHCDPEFVKPGGGETNNWASLASYQLKDTSKAIGAGKFIDAKPQTTSNNRGHWNHTGDRNATADFFGNTLYTGAPDMGIHETTSPSNQDFTIEKNAVYKLYNPTTKLYIENNEESGLILNSEEVPNQGFTIVGATDGYKIRIWDSEKNNYVYLSIVNGMLVLSETEQTIWSIEDLHTGLFKLKSGVNYVTVENNTAAIKTDSDAETQKWYLRLEEHSNSFNTGGLDIEGYSADQECNEDIQQSGYYGDVTKVQKEISGEEVYKTGLKGEEIGYKFYVTPGEYNLKLNFAELESVTNRTFDILINNQPYDVYTMGTGNLVKEIASIYPENGVIDIRLVAAYNDASVLTEALLNGIMLEKKIMSEVNTRINAGSEQQFDGLSADAEYPTKGSGYYGESSTISSTLGLPNPDAGMGTVLKSAREGVDFGYKFKVQPGEYRVKLYFNEFTEEDHTFDVIINGEKIRESFSVETEAGGKSKAVDITAYTEAVGGLVDIQLKAVNNSKAMINAVIVEPYKKIEGTNLALNSIASAGSEGGSNTAQAAIDNNQSTRWSATDSGEQWIMLDLQNKYMIDNVAVDWTPGAYATQYRIETSEDGVNFNTIATITEAIPGLNITSLNSEVARYIKIVGEERNDQWGISLTELGVYGTEVRGDAEAVVTTKNINEKQYEAKVEAQNIYKRYKTMTVKMTYNSEMVKYVNATYPNESSLAQIATSEPDNTNPKETTIEYRFNIKKADGFMEKADILNATFEAIGTERSYVYTDIALTDAAGHVTTLPTKRVYVPDEITKEELIQLVQTAQEMHDNAVVGSKRGEYTQEAKDMFYTAIQEAKEVADSTQAGVEDYKKAYLALEDARDIFKASEIVAQYVNYHKDYLIDKTIDYSNGATVVDSVAKINVSNGQVNIDQESPELAAGTLYARFSVDNVDDQTLFVLKHTEVKDIIVGYDAGSGNWFYEDASAVGWGNFPLTMPLTANKEHEVMIQFTPNEDGTTYQVSLEYDNESLGSVNATYHRTPGRAGFKARSAAKVYTVKELYYTNAPKHTIKVSINGDGTASQTGDVTVFSEADKTLFFYPSDGQKIESVKVDGQVVELKENAYTLEYITKDHNVEVTFTGKTPDEEKEEPTTYHKDYMVATEANYNKSEFVTDTKIENGVLKIVTADSGSQQNFAIARDMDTPKLTEGTFYTRFSVDNIEDQVFFDIKSGDQGYIRIGYDYDKVTEIGKWFWDKTSTGGWGDFPQQMSELLKPNTEYELKLDFLKKAENLYDITLYIDGESLGTVSNVDYITEPGNFAFGTRQKGKTIDIKEVYYTNQEEFHIQVTAGENGTASQTGKVTTFGKGTKTIFFVPEEGFEVDTVTVDNKEVSITDNQYTFENIDADHVLSVTFKQTKTQPTATPSADPTATPSADPTATPSADPTATPSVEPTATPPVRPTEEPEQPPVEIPTQAPPTEPTATATPSTDGSPTLQPTKAPDNVVVSEDENTKTEVSTTEKEDSGKVITEMVTKVTDKKTGEVTETTVKEEEDKDGNKVVDIVRQTTDSKIKASLSIDNKQEITASVDVTPEKAKANISGNKANIKVNVNTSAVKEVVEILKEQANNKLNNEVLNIKVTIPQEDVIEQMNSSNIANIIVGVNMLAETENYKVNEVVLPAKAISRAKDTNKNLKVELRDENNKFIATWSVKKAVLQSFEGEIKDINLALDLKQVSKLSEGNKVVQDIIAADKNNQTDKSILISFEEKKEIFPITVNVAVKGTSAVKPGDKVYLYAINSQTKQLEEVANNSYIVSKAGNAAVHLTTGGDYVLLPKKADSNSLSLTEQIKVVVDNKSATTTTLGVGEAINLKVNVPSTVKQVTTFSKKLLDKAVGEAKVTYKSSNSKIASISKNGEITGKKTGKATITTTVILNDGREKVTTTTVTIK